MRGKWFALRLMDASVLLMFLAASGCGEATKPQPQPQSRLVLQGCTHWEQGHLWCAASVFDQQSHPVTSLTLSDFQLTEEVLGQSRRNVSLESAERFFEDPGFYERSVTADRLDLIFVIDVSMSMEQFIAAMKPELHALLDELYSRRVDFRLGFMQYDNHFNGTMVDPLRGPMDQAALRAAIDRISVRGEWWVPAATFDAMLLAGDGASQGLAWREGAEHIVVAVSDSFSASSYGADWYTGWCTNTNQAAVRQILKARPFRLYYAYAPWAGVEGTDPSNDSYASSDTNPKALSESMLKPFGESLPWPLTAYDLLAALNLKATEVVDSVYYFAWESGLDLLKGSGQKVVVNISVTQPEGVFRTQGSVPAVLSQQDISLQVRDVLSGQVSDATAILLSQMGDLTQEVSWDNVVSNGQVNVPAIQEGKFLLRVISDGVYEYSELRWFVEQALTVTPGGQTVFDVTAPIADIAQEISRTRGMLDDIAAFAPADRPFADYATDVRAWLDSLESRGMDAKEMERLKRFNVGLSGYVNALGYGEAMIEGAVQDFVDAARELTELFTRTEETKDELQSDVISWDTLILLATYLIDRDIDAIEKWAEDEAAVELLKEVVLKELVPKAIEWMLDLIRENCDNASLAADIIQLVEQLVFSDWDDNNQALGQVVLKIAGITLNLVLDPVVEEVSDDIKQELLDALSAEVGAEVPEEAAEIVRVGLEAIWAGFQALLDNSSETSFLNAVGIRVQAALAKMGEPKNVKIAVSFLLDVLKSRSGPGMMRDFVLPLLDMILRTAVDVYGGGKVDNDLVVEVLARLFCNYVLIKPYFADPLEDGMRNLLAEAQGFEPRGEFLERSDAMKEDYWNWRGTIMQEANNAARGAMAIQETVESIDQWLSGAEWLLGTSEYLTAATCLKYPDFCETAFEDVPNLINLIRGLRVMTNIIEFAMKLDGANDLAESVSAGNTILWATP